MKLVHDQKQNFWYWVMNTHAVSPSFTQKDLAWVWYHDIKQVFARVAVDKTKPLPKLLSAF